MPESPVSAQVPMDVEWQPAWLTWVAATTSCLRALGCDVDLVDVAGVSGYAFVLTIHRDLCPSGPTVFPWGSLVEGIPALGRTALQYLSYDCHTGDARREHERTCAHCRAVFDMVSAEIAAGRPCVLWGAYVPEFAVAVGVEDGCYHVKSFRQCLGQPEEPIPWDALEAPGGPYALAFPTATAVPLGAVDHRSLLGAISRLLPRVSGAEGPGDPQYVSGIDAYALWADALESGRDNPYGAAYNAQCYAEARRFARDYLARVAERNPGVPALDWAVDCYTRVAGDLSFVASRFDFPPVEGEPDAEDREECIANLLDAQAAEAEAADALIEAVTHWSES